MGRSARLRVGMLTSHSSTVLLLFMLLRVGCFGAKVNQECQSINNVLKGKGFTSYQFWERFNSEAHGGSGSSQLTSNNACQASTNSRNDKTSKCCGFSLDTPLHHKEMSSIFNQKWLAPKLTANAEVFKEKKISFDEKFKAMLNGAHTSFHAMFERTYGMLYIQHAHVFHALFTTLEKYYEDGRDSLESKLNEFFAILTRKMFEVLNAQYEFDNSYLHCATITISEKQGNDIHRQIVSSLRRSFVATRALSQGLLVGEKIISNLKMIQMNGSECLTPLALMLHCPVCAEQRAYKPCIPLCTATTGKCLASMGALSKPWLEYITSLENIIDRLLGPYNIEAVVEPIHIKISEIIMNFQENGHDLSQTVFSHCGKPTLRSRISRSISLAKREASPDPPPKRRPLPASSGPIVRRKDGSGVKAAKRLDEKASQDKNIEKLLREVKNKIKKSKSLFDVLPKQVCNGISKDYSSQQCWNGTGILKPDKGGSGGSGAEDGTADVLDLKPSLAMGKGPANPLVTEQIFLLQAMTEKLRNAFNGLDVQWVTEIDSDDFGSGDGSGSGESPSDLEDTDDDDPAGRIYPDFKMPTNNSPPNFTRINPFTPNRTPPPIFNPLPGSDLDTDSDTDNEEEEEDDNDDGSLNLNINSNEKSGNNGLRNGPNNNNGGGPTSTNEDNSGIDFGILVNPQPPPIIRVKTTTPAPITTSTRPTGKNTPGWKNEKDKDTMDEINRTTVTSNNNKLEGAAGKAIAVIKLFTPVFMSMLGKLFPF